LALRAWKSLTPAGRGLPAEGPPGARYFRRPDALRPGNRIELLSGGGETYPAMLAAIEGAARSVHLETFTLRHDRTGRRFQQALIAAAGRGVEVRVIYDAVGSLALSEDFVEELRAAGVETVEYRPIAPWRHRWGLNRRDHQKLLVVDAETAFIGGTNISDEYDPAGLGWHDVHARIRGPIVGDLGRLFRRTWLRAGGAPDDDRVRDPGPAEGPGFDALIETIDNYGFRNRGRMHRDYRHAIRQAQTSVHVANAYFIPDRLLRRALRKAARNGADVRVIVPGLSDVAVARFASRHLYARLLRWGVQIHEYRGPMMHAKCAVIDGAWSTIGSYNLDVRSMIHNLESGVVCLSTGFAGALEAEFQRLLGECRRVSLEEWVNRPWWNFVLEWVSYRFRYWL